MNEASRNKTMTVALALLTVVSASGCYSFKAARKDIADKETELQQLQNEINQESRRRKTLENESRTK